MSNAAYQTVPSENWQEHVTQSPRDEANNALLDAFGGLDSDDETDWVDDRTSSARSSQSSNSQPTQTSARPRSGTSRWQGLLNRITNYQGQTQLLDGVFENLVAKEETDTSNSANAEALPEEDDDITPAEQPPSYDEASADATPSYWETTIMATSWGDEIIVGEMPVGSILHFAWNLLISVAFSYLGLLLTYLFHTTHAAKGGSLTGFGATLIQSSYDLRPTETTPPGAAPPEFAPSDPNSFEDGPPIGYVLHPTGQPATQPQLGAEDGKHSSFLANLVLICGIILVIKGLCDYGFALRMQSVILKRQRNQEESSSRAQEEGRNAYEAERQDQQGRADNLPNDLAFVPPIEP